MEKNMNSKFGPPSTIAEFDKAYNSLFHWIWSDFRIPKELKELIATKKPTTSLELGCGIGRFSCFMAEHGITATGVDFSSIAIKKATNRIENHKRKPIFITGDVTNLEMIRETFDVSFDVGCFHCLNEEEQKQYVKEVYRLLKPGGIHLLWTLDNLTPCDIKMNPTYISNIFGSYFQLIQSQLSRRRVVFVASHWYWLLRTSY